MYSMIFNLPKGTHFCVRTRGSFTIEAAVGLPVYLMAVVAMLFFLRIVTIEYAVSQAMNRGVETLAVTEAAVSEPTAVLASTVLFISENLISNNAPLTYIDGGALGMTYNKSSVTGSYIHMVVEYRVKIPFLLFGNYTWKVQQEAIGRRWVGYDPTEMIGATDYVYVTPYGEVYHDSLNCNFLNLSIETTTMASIGSKRNSSGSKYQACPICGGEGAIVYYTKYGENYHNSVTCSGLKRTLRKMKKEEAALKYRACPKCIGGD